MAIFCCLRPQRKFPKPTSGPATTSRRRRSGVLGLSLGCSAIRLRVAALYRVLDHPRSIWSTMQRLRDEIFSTLGSFVFETNARGNALYAFNFRLCWLGTRA